MEHTPQDGVAETRKRQNIKIDGDLHIRLVTLSDSLGMTPTAMADAMITRGCETAEVRSQADIVDALLGGQS